MLDPYSAIIDLLNSSQVPYEVIEHPPVYTSQEAADIRGFTLSAGAKSLLLKAGDRFVLLILPGDKRLNTKKAKELLGVKNLRFAKPEEVESIMGCTIGACYPFGSIIQTQAFVDETLSLQPVISFNPGKHDISITMKWSDYVQVVKPEIRSFVE
jgi:Ala-tRNA(Pro) deacylase